MAVNLCITVIFSSTPAHTHHTQSTPRSVAVVVSGGVVRSLWEFGAHKHPGRSSLPYLCSYPRKYVPVPVSLLSLLTPPHPTPHPNVSCSGLSPLNQVTVMVR